MQAVESKSNEHGCRAKVSKVVKKMQASPDKEERRDGGRKGRKPGRKSAKIDMRAKLERSRQSARECRARKKIRYQYLEELVADRERAVLALRKELETYKQWSRALDEGIIPDGALKLIEGEMKQEKDHVQDMNEN